MDGRYLQVPAIFQEARPATPSIHICGCHHPWMRIMHRYSHGYTCGYQWKHPHPWFSLLLPMIGARDSPCPHMQSRATFRPCHIPSGCQLKHSALPFNTIANTLRISTMANASKRGMKAKALVKAETRETKASHES